MNTPIFLCQCLIRVHIFSFHHLQNYIYIYIYKIKMTVLTLQVHTNQIRTCREIKVYTCWNHKFEVKRKSYTLSLSLSLSLSPPPPFYILNKTLPPHHHVLIILRHSILIPRTHVRSNPSFTQLYRDLLLPDSRQLNPLLQEA